MSKKIQISIISDDDYMKYKKEVEEMERLIIAAKRSYDKIEQQQKYIIHSSNGKRKVLINKSNDKPGKKLRIVIG